MLNETFIQNVQIPLNEQICVSKMQFADLLKDICKQAVITKPVLFISIAFILDFVEWFLRNKYWGNNLILIDKKFYRLDTNEILIMVSFLKSMSLLLALIFIITGVRIWTG